MMALLKAAPLGLGPTAVLRWAKAQPTAFINESRSYALTTSLKI